MNIKFSDYLPQNLRTFKIKALYGGTYGATFKFFDNEWTPYEYIKNRRDYYDFSSLSIYINGEIKTDYTFKNFYNK